MKKLTTIFFCVLFVISMTGSAFAVEYCLDFLEEGNPGGMTAGLKTCDRVNPERVNPGETFTMDIWVKGLPESILSSGFLMLYNPIQLRMRSFEAYDGIAVPAEPWDGDSTFKVPGIFGPGSYLLSLLQLSCAGPVEGGDVILARATFEYMARGNAYIILLPIPYFATTVGCDSGYNYDAQLGFSLLTITQVETGCSDGFDNDRDGFIDCADSDCTQDTACCGTVVIEAEEMEYHANGRQVEDYWGLWANGSIRENVDFSATRTYRFEVIAKAGILGDDIGSLMGLLIDGVLVDSAVFVDTTTPETFIFEADVSEGVHEVAIRFYNDLWLPPDVDRNLYVDKITITPRDCVPSEFACTDGLDNDVDGLIDCADPDCTGELACCGTVVIEAEEMDYHANGRQSGDYWLLWANGMMSEEGVHFSDAGMYRFEVIAKGDLAYDIGPEMGLLIDGVLVDDAVFVNTTIPETFVFDVEIAEGAHTVAIRFYNDVWIRDVIDRNLYVDKITLTLLSCDNM